MKTKKINTTKNGSTLFSNTVRFSAQSVHHVRELYHARVIFTGHLRQKMVASRHAVAVGLPRKEWRQTMIVQFFVPRHAVAQEMESDLHSKGGQGSEGKTCPLSGVMHAARLPMEYRCWFALSICFHIFMWGYTAHKSVHWHKLRNEALSQSKISCV